jgi:hypothetical protein
MHVWIARMILWIGSNYENSLSSWSKQKVGIIELNDLNYLNNILIWDLTRWVFYSSYRDHMIYKLQKKLQITWKQTTMNATPLLAIV